MQLTIKDYNRFERKNRKNIWKNKKRVTTTGAFKEQKIFHNMFYYGFII